MGDRKRAVIIVVILVVAAGLIAWRLMSGPSKRPGPVGGVDQDQAAPENAPAPRGGARVAPGGP